MRDSGITVSTDGAEWREGTKRPGQAWEALLMGGVTLISGCVASLDVGAPPKQ